MTQLVPYLLAEFNFVSYVTAIVPYLLALLLAGLVMLGWTLTLFGLPGNWLMLLASTGYAWLGPAEGAMQLQWSTVVGISVLCVVGEVVENVAGMWGARKAGGSRRAAVFALLGSLIGAVAGGMLGLPIPIVGTPIGAILGGALGALLGAVLAEQTLGESGSKALQVGHAAFWGRLLGVGAKTILATVIAGMIVVAVFV